MTTVSNFNTGESVVLSSTDAVTWTESNNLTSTESSVEAIAIANDRIVAVRQTFLVEDGTNRLDVLVSDDGGVTFTEAGLPTELFGPFGQVLTGPAGFVISLDGNTEPFDAFSPFGDTDVIELENDGYTLVLPLGFPGELELFGPDGVSVHGPIGQDAILGDGVDGVIRFEGPFQETMIWLDPATGEDLVSFTEGDFDEAFAPLESQFDDADFVEPDRATEIWFSVDGESWELLTSFDSNFDSDSFTTLAAVGDDEALLRTESFNQPPDELFAFDEEGRAPTAAEEAALDEWFLNQEDSVIWEAVSIG